ncbi:MAG TPA: YihY/virulence factor BrkB family protein [Lacibacter sp.]|nr:YihY/virulence factor BrkB family protein [Lacibacter sp.]HMO89748.1 YihY/virulence factor BrkB family protein [Lacibacter sp.]
MHNRSADSYIRVIFDALIHLYKYPLRNPVIRNIVRMSMRIKPPGFEGVALYYVIKFFFQKVRTVGLNERAAAISFNFILAIPPFCIFLFSLVPLFPIADDFNRELMSFVRDLTPNPETRDLVQDFLNDFLGRPRNSLLSAGFLFVVYYSSNAMLGIIHSFNRSIHERESKGLFAYRWKAIRLTFIIVLLFIASMLVLMTQGTVFTWMLNQLGIQNWFLQQLVQVVRWLIILGLFFYSIAFIYRHAPSVEKKWKLISPGSILACTLLILFLYGFSLWINTFATYNKIYGPIGTIMVLMILIYMNSLVLLIGFELNVSIKSLKARTDKRLHASTKGVRHQRRKL